jgi:hypothetical protein
VEIKNASLQLAFRNGEASAPFLIAIDDLPVHTIDDLPKRLPLYDSQHAKPRSTFTHDEVHNNLTAQGVSKLYFEQFYRIRDHLDDIRSPKAHKHTRRALTADWPEWKRATTSNSASSAQQRMFTVIPAFLLMPPSSTGCG